MIEDEDEIITVNNVNYSLRKILGSGFNTYAKADDKLKRLVKLKVTLDLMQIENTFTRINEK